MPGIAGIISKRPAGRMRGDRSQNDRHDGARAVLYFRLLLDPRTGSACGLDRARRLLSSQPAFCKRDEISCACSRASVLSIQKHEPILKRKGHTLETDNDWLVHLYEEEGERFFEKLNGLFSGVLIDKRRNQAFLFNDRYGSERIYWCQTRDATYFASEAKAILRVVPETRAFDARGIADFLSYECTLEGRTLFRGIQLLPGASVWSFKDGQCRKAQIFFASDMGVAASSFRRSVRIWRSRKSSSESYPGTLNRRVRLASH